MMGGTREIGEQCSSLSIIICLRNDFQDSLQLYCVWSLTAVTLQIYQE